MQEFIRIRIQDFVKNTNIHSIYKFLVNNQTKSPKDINQIQWEKLIKILDYGYNNVPYYKELFDKNDINPNKINDYNDFLKIPILTKELARENQSKLISKNYKKYSCKKKCSWENKY